MKKNNEALGSYKKKFSAYLNKELKMSGLSLVGFCKKYGLSACSMSNFISGDMLPSFPTLHQLALIRHNGRLGDFLNDVLGEESGVGNPLPIIPWNDPSILPPEYMLPEECYRRKGQSPIITALDTWLKEAQNTDPTMADAVRKRYVYRRVLLDYDVPEEPPEVLTNKKSLLVLPKILRELITLDTQLSDIIERYLCGHDFPKSIFKFNGKDMVFNYCFKNIWYPQFEAWGLFSLPRIPRQNIWMGRQAWFSCFKHKLQKTNTNNIFFGYDETLFDVPPYALEELTNSLRTFAYDLKFSYEPQKGGARVTLFSTLASDPE